MDGFKTFDFSIRRPYMTATEHGVTFSKGVTQQLGLPRYAKLLISEQERLLLILPCDKGEAGARRFYKPGARVMSVRWNESRLLAELGRLMDADFGKTGRRVDGEPRAEGGVLFDLKKAKTLK